MTPGDEHLMPMRMQVRCMKIDRAVTLYAIGIWSTLDLLVWLLAG